MDSKAKSIGWACFWGGIIAMATWTVATNFLWGISGFVAGSIAAYILYDLRGFASDLKTARQEYRKNILAAKIKRAEVRAKMQRWNREHAEVSRARIHLRWARLVTGFVVTSASSTLLYVTLLSMDWPVNPVFGLIVLLSCAISLSTYVTVALARLKAAECSLELFKVVPGESLYSTRKTRYYDWDGDGISTDSLYAGRDQIVSTYRNAARAHWRFCLEWNVITYVAFWPLYWLYRAAVSSPKWMPITVRSIGTFLVTLVRLVHNQRRVTCAAWVIVGTAVTATLLVEPGMNPVGKLLVVATNGSLCALLGIADYELVKRFKPNWLPANGNA